MGTPRRMPDLHGGDGFAVLDGTARMLDDQGRDVTRQMLDGAQAMVDLALREQVDFAVLVDRSGACGSQVVSLGCRFEQPVRYVRGVGVAAAALLRAGVCVVSQRDFHTLGLLGARLGEPRDADALDHHEHPWVVENLPQPDHALIAAIRQALEAAAVPSDAAPMQAYMKSALPFWGVRSPARTQALKPVWRRLDPVTRRATARELFLTATHREEWYAGLKLLARAPRLSLDDVPLLIELVQHTAWWDTVDDLAANRLGPLLKAHRDELTPTVRGWIDHDDGWLRRTSILVQLKHRDATDLDLLTDAIDDNLESSWFFLRKAIGWALRSYAQTDPDWVRAFVAARPQMSGLSRREALKHLDG